MAVSPEFPESQSNGDLASPWSNPYYPTQLNIQYVDGWASTTTATTSHWGYRTHTIDTVNRDWQISGWFDNTDVSGDGFIEIFFGDGSGDGYSLGVGNAYHLYPYAAGVRGAAFALFDKTTAAYVPVYVEVTFEYATGEWRVYENGVEQGNQVHTTHQAADKTTFGAVMYSDDSPQESRWRKLTIKDYIDVTGPPAESTPTPTTVAVSATIPTPAIAVRSNPTVRSAASTGVSAACTTGVTVTKPTGVADGDVLFAFVSKTNYSNTAAFTCSGWTEISSGTRGTTTGNDRHVTILRKVITNAAGEGSNYTFVTTFGTTCSMCATIICVTGADTTTPEDISVPSITFGSNDATPASRDSTSVTAGALVLSYCQLSLGTTAVKTWGAPSGYTAPSGGDTSVVASSLNNQHGVAYKTLATVGAAGTNVWTHTVDDAGTENSRAIVIVRPAATTIVTPAVVAISATIPAPTIDTTTSGDATATPSVVAISAAVPSPTVTTTATPTPAVVAVAATVPAPVVSASASVLASVVSVAASVFAVTILATATVAPSLVSAAATIPAPTITATATVTPDVVPISATVPAPTITVGTIITPSTVAALATVPSPTVTGSATVTPSAVAVSATIPSPAVTTSATVTPTAVAVSATIPSPTITATATVAPSAVAISATVPAPTITATATVTPSVVPITVTVSAPTITTGTIVDPSVVPITVVVPAPTITGSATVEPSAVTISATVPAPTISASTNATATPTTVDVAATLPSPTITATATVTPTTVAASATIPAPTITTTVTVAPSVVPITVTVSAPTITATGTPTPATVAITASVGAPVIDAASAIGDPGIVCLAVTAADVTLTATAPTVALATTAPTVTLAVTCATLELVATCATVALTLSEDC